LVESFTSLKKKHHFFEELPYLMRAWPCALNLIATNHDCHIGEAFFNPSQKFVSLPKKFRHEVSSGHHDGDSGGGDGHVPSCYLLTVSASFPYVSMGA
jgi:hypothetical protein